MSASTFEELDHSDKVRESVSLYQSLGLIPFPVCRPLGQGTCIQHGKCSSPGKRPLIQEWQTLRNHPKHQTYLLDVFESHDWDTNIGLLTGIHGSLVVLDVDGQEGMDAIRDQDIPPTVEVLTGRVGGRHYWFKPTMETARKIGIARKVDLLGECSFVLAPPSVHASGNEYRFSGQLRETLPPLPSWVHWLQGLPQVVNLPFVEDDSGVGIGQRTKDFLTNGAQECQREEAIHAIANLLGRGVDRDQILRDVSHALIDLSPQTRPWDPWTTRDVEKIVREFEEKPMPPRESGEWAKDFVIPEKEPRTDHTDALDLWDGMILRKEASPREYLIEGVLRRGEFLWLFGGVGCGKTLLAIDWAMHIATGRTWQGNREVKQGNVLIIEQDRKGNEFDHLESLYDAGQWDPGELRGKIKTHPDPNFNLRDDRGVNEFLSYIDSQEPDFVITDSFRDFSDGGFEDRTYIPVKKFRDAMKERRITCIMIDHAIKNPEHGDNASKRDIDKLAGGQAKSRIVDRALYLAGALKPGPAELRWAKEQEDPSDDMIVQFSSVTGFSVKLKADGSKIELNKSEQKIIGELATKGPATQDMLLRWTGLSENTLKRHLPKLIVREIVIREGGGQGRGNAAVYRIGPGPEMFGAAR